MRALLYSTLVLLCAAPVWAQAGGVSPPSQPGANGPTVTDKRTARSNPRKPRPTPAPPDAPKPSDEQPNGPPVNPPTSPGGPIRPGNNPLAPGTRPPNAPPPPPTAPPPDGGPKPTTPPARPPEGGPTPKAPETEPAKGPQPRTPGSGARRGRGSAGDGWLYWWYYNRGQLIDFRGLLRSAGPVSGSAPKEQGDRIATQRERVRHALRAVALSRDSSSLRAAALIALGRIGEDDDANLFLHLLEKKDSDATVTAAAALSLGLLPPIEHGETRVRVREYLQYYLQTEGHLDARAHALTIVAAGLRARDDRMLVMHMAAPLGDPQANGLSDRESVAALLFGAGLTRDRMLVPELLEATRKGRMGKKVKLPDVLHSHAATALGHMGDGVAIPTLVALLRSRKARAQTKRSAVLALGRILRDAKLTDDARNKGVAALRAVARKNGEVELRGFALLAMGSAKDASVTRELMQIIDRGGDAQLKPYAALALGFAGRTLPAAKTRSIKRFLAGELEKVREQDLHATLCLALGLARARDSHAALLERVEDTRLSRRVRSHAIQAIGLLGRPSPRADKALKGILDDGPNELVGDAALALGLIGRRSVAPRLVKQLKKSKSRSEQAGIVVALGQLAHAGTSDALVELLEQRKQSRTLRAYAATALGYMYDTRRHDALFDMAADFNFYATTAATHEILRLY